MSRNKKNTAPAALPCPVRSVLLPADALHVPVRVHEGPCQYVCMRIRAHQKPPIPPATNLVSRFGGSGNGLSHELPAAKAAAELVHQTSCIFRVQTEGTCVGQMKLPPGWFFSAPVTHSSGLNEQLPLRLRYQRKSFIMQSCSGITDLMTRKYTAEINTHANREAQLSQKSPTS